MKTLYWHRHLLPRTVMLLYCAVVLLGLLAVEQFKQKQPQPYFVEKYQAAHLSADAMALLKKERLNIHLPIVKRTDPAETGLIGEKLSLITTDVGVLSVKQALLNPNIAALFILWLKALHVQKGDTVAVAMTGSFPGVNIALLSALKTLGLHPLIILSAGASQYGANLTHFTWIDMYHHLQSAGIFPFPPLAASLGGVGDSAQDMPKAGRHFLEESIHRNRYRFLDAKDTRNSIDQRMALYQAAKITPIVAYINVGGGVASIGLTPLAHRTPPTPLPPKPLALGLITTMPVSLAYTDSVAVRFLKEGVPVINVHDIPTTFLKQYGFIQHAHTLTYPGTGTLFYRTTYNRIWVSAALFLDIILFVGIALLSHRYHL